MSKLLAAAAAAANGETPTQQRLKISDIQRNGGTQPREGMNEDVVRDYTAALENGETLPAVEACFDGSKYWLWDGFHRVEAHQRLNITEISAAVRSGTLEDAQWLSYSANKRHGLRRSASDKRRAVEAALRHPKGATISDRQIAEHCGVDHKTVGDVRQSMQSTGEIPQSHQRTGRDGRTINTKSIGSNLRVDRVTGEFPQSKPPPAVITAENPQTTPPTPVRSDFASQESERARLRHVFQRAVDNLPAYNQFTGDDMTRTLLVLSALVKRLDLFGEDKR